MSCKLRHSHIAFGRRVVAAAGLLLLSASTAVAQSRASAPTADVAVMPAAVFVTWDGNPSTTVSIDWHLLGGMDITAVETRLPGAARWTRHTGASFQFPHSTRTVRRARVTGLRPGTEYELRIGASRVYRYRTMPATLTRPVRFATGGDTQASDATFGATNRMVAKQNVDFVLLGGDLAYSNGDPRLVDREELWFETVTRTLVTAEGRLIPVIAAIGNHEVFSNRDTTEATRLMVQRTGVQLGDATWYRRLHAHAKDRQYGVVDVGDYMSLVLLNTAHTAPIAGVQTEWLRETLSARRSVPHVFPVYHVPGYPSVRAFEASNSTAVRENWAPLFEGANVRAAFENHDHAYKRTHPLRSGKRDSTGVVYMGDGSWGAGPRPVGRDHKEPVPYLEKTESVNHAIIVTIDKSSARMVVLDSAAAVVDSVTVSRRSVSNMTDAAASSNGASRGTAAPLRPTNSSSAASARTQQGAASRWLAGDHHIHSEFSANYPLPAPGSNEAPKPVLGADGRYGIPLNARMARRFGLAWMVATDHGGPNHSKLNHDHAYPEMQLARRTVPEVVQFFGMEFDTPGADHSSMIVPHSSKERGTLRDIESRFSKREVYPSDSTRDTEPKMLEALRYMRGVETPPVVIANHPSRSATGVGKYGQDKPSELRDWNDAAPSVAIGMEGAPGHQAGAINKDGSIDTSGVRGGYRNSPTLGGFDQMTARVGGFWDSMLGEGRRWWITSTSDSHSNWRDGGSDFWPGEYSKTYVNARHTHDALLAALRAGRVFVTTGDLISELDITARVVRAGAAPTGVAAPVHFGSELAVPAGSDVELAIRVRDPDAANSHGDTPSVARLDVITGDVTGKAADRSIDRNASARVLQRFAASDWQRDGEILTMRITLRNVRGPSYLRLRGTNTTELEPTPDPHGESPWTDLWFYSNPVFISVR
ncbi:MAG TPA: fibronectin type III domain-containing protein [Gemmatimonas sp.]|nr:fibronectin type III domain-containing protein [Gemmatimonas sp.]